MSERGGGCVGEGRSRKVLAEGEEVLLTTLGSV